MLSFLTPEERPSSFLLFLFPMSVSSFLALELDFLFPLQNLSYLLFKIIKGIAFDPGAIRHSPQHPCSSFAPDRSDPDFESRVGGRTEYTLKVRYGKVIPKKSLQLFILGVLHCRYRCGILSLGSRPR